MNKILIALAAVVVLGMSGEQSSGSDNPDSTSGYGSFGNKSKPLMRGETKVQVRARFRDPDQVTHDAEHGESWLYVFGKDRFLGISHLFPSSSFASACSGSISIGRGE